MKKIFTPLMTALLIAHISCLVSVAQWVTTAGPPGITVTRFFENDSALFVGTYAQGVYKSYDHGNTWSACNTGIENLEVITLEADSLYIYAGTGTEGVYRTADQGATWTAANPGIQTLAVSSLLNAAGFIFAGTRSTGLYRSADHGNSWQDASGGALGSSSIHAMFYAGSRLTVEADNYLFYSFDFGESWYVDNGPTAFNVIDNFLQQGDTVIAAANGKVFVTTDGGMNWSDAIILNPDIDILGLDRIEDTIYAGYANGVYFSSDWGSTWNTNPSSGLRFGTRFDSHFKISGTRFLISCQEIGIYQSNDKGLTWTQVPHGNFEPASTIDNCIIFSGNTLFSGTHSDGVYLSTDEGHTWYNTGTTDPMDTLSNSIIFSMLTPAPQIILAGACGYGLYRSTDDGFSWTHITDGLPVQEETGFTCFNALAKSESNIIAGTTEGIYYSGDNGLTWNPSNLTGLLVDANCVAADRNIVCAGISSFTFGSGIYRSTDNGMNFTMISEITDVISMAGDGENYFYAGTFSGNYYSPDNGLSWFDSGGIPPGEPGFCFLAFGENVFLGNNHGVYFSDDHAASFTNVSTGMDPYPNNAVQGFATDSNYIYAGLYLDAIWKRPLADFGIITGIPDKNSTHPGFIISPNPAADEINISGIKFNFGDEVAILDVTGRIISDKKLNGSAMNLRFKISNLPDGIYLVRVQHEKVTTVQKFIKE